MKYIKPNFTILAQFGWLLTLLACLNSVHAAVQLNIPITGENLQGVQQVDLNLAAIAAANTSAQQLHVIDAGQQIMPLRIDHPVNDVQRLNFGLQLYRWPEPELFHDVQRLKQLQLQLKQGEQQATVIFPDRPALNLSQQGMDQTWLLVSPKLPKSLQVEALDLQWNANDFSSTVQVEGSNNLVDWQFAGLGQILQTKNSLGDPLLQQRVEINQAYTYWRIRFDQPLKLQHVNLVSRAMRLPQWRQQAFTLQKGAENSNQWYLTLPYAVAIQKMQFSIPANQLWSVNVEAKQYQQGRDYWYTVAQNELYHWQNIAGSENTAATSRMDEIEWNVPVSAKEWRVTIQAPISMPNLTIQAFAPKATLLFLAQGNAPYQLKVNSADLRPSPGLPQHLKPIATQQLGTISVQTIQVSNRQYGLWAGLILLVAILAIAAWRLFKGMQNESLADK